MNKVTITITSCEDCPNATLKRLPETGEEFMFCQTFYSCIRLRKGWGDRIIPNWCPRLREQRVTQEVKE